MSSPWPMAPLGHSGSHAPQLMHSSVIVVAIGGGLLDPAGTKRVNQVRQALSNARTSEVKARVLLRVSPFARRTTLWTALFRSTFRRALRRRGRVALTTDDARRAAPRAGLRASSCPPPPRPRRAAPRAR